MLIRAPLGLPCYHNNSTRGFKLNYDKSHFTRKRVRRYSFASEMSLAFSSFVPLATIKAPIKCPPIECQRAYCAVMLWTDPVAH